MAWLRHLRFGPRLALLLAAFCVGFMAYGGWTWYAMQKVSVGGPLYQRIEDSQQLVSDVLPPPDSIIEAYLTCVQLSSGLDGYAPGALVDRLKALHRVYLERHRHWQQAPLPPALGDALRQADAPAQAFYTLVNAELLRELLEARGLLATRPIGGAGRRPRRGVETSHETEAWRVSPKTTGSALPSALP